MRAFLRTQQLSAGSIVPPPRDLESSRLLPALQCAHKVHTTVAQSGHCAVISARTGALRGIHSAPTKRLGDFPTLQCTHKLHTTVALSSHQAGISARTTALSGIYSAPTKRLRVFKATTRTAVRTQGACHRGSKWPLRGHFCPHSGT